MANKTPSFISSKEDKEENTIDRYSYDPKLRRGGSIILPKIQLS